MNSFFFLLGGIQRYNELFVFSPGIPIQSLLLIYSPPVVCNQIPYSSFMPPVATSIGPTARRTTLRTFDWRRGGGGRFFFFRFRFDIHHRTCLAFYTAEINSLLSSTLRIDSRQKTSPDGPTLTQRPTDRKEKTYRNPWRRRQSRSATGSDLAVQRVEHRNLSGDAVDAEQVPSASGNALG